MSEQLIITGKVRLQETLQPLNHVKVELWDNEDILGHISTVVTNAEGDFSFYLSGTPASDISTGISTTLFKVYNGAELIIENSLAGYVGTVNIDIPTATYDNSVKDNIEYEESIKYILVRGSIVNQNDSVLENIRINIYESGFRDKNLIGFVHSDFNGQFEKQVSVKYIGNSKTQKSRVIKLEAVNGTDTVIAFSEDIDISNIDINVQLRTGIENQSEAEYDGLETTHYDRLKSAINYVTDSIDIKTIGDNDTTDNTNEVAYIASTTNFDIVDINTIVLAYKVADGISASTDAEISIMYSLFYQAAGANDIMSFSEAEITSLAENAIESKIIPDVTGDIPGLITKIKTAQVTRIKDELVQDESYTLNDVLNEAFASQVDVDDFVAEYNDVRFNSSDLNTSIENLSTDAKKALELCTVAMFQKDIVAALSTEVQSEDNLYTLGEKDESYWSNLIDTVSTNTGTLAVPGLIQKNYDIQNTPSDVDAAKAEYGRILKETVQQKYPLSKVKFELSGVNGDQLVSDLTRRTDVITFLDTNRGFDFRKDSVSDVDNFDLTGIVDVDLLKEDLEPFQRLSNIVPTRPDALVQIAADGYKSARDISEISIEEFVESYSSLLGDEKEAASAYAIAETLSAVSESVLMDVKPYAQTPDIAVFNHGNTPLSFNSVSDTDANLATIFGNQNYCSCQHCKSMYSPTAYYTDMLNFLEKKVSNKNVISELFRRRPDLQHIELSCKNANTVLPYIDLTNEVLENYILYKTSGATQPPSSYQTNGNEKELSAYPQHVYTQIVNNEKVFSDHTAYAEVYDNIINNSIYPASLPFSLSLEETRVYLGHMKTTRFDLFKLFKPYRNPEVNGITDLAYYSEFFKTTYSNSKIITGTHVSSSNTWLFYGLGVANSTGLSDGSGVQDPVDGTSYLYGVWDVLLAGRVDVLTTQANISYEELLQLLTTTFLNPADGNGDREISIILNDIDQYTTSVPEDTCQTQYLKLDAAAQSTITSFLGKMYRFVRLARITGLSMYELDTLLRVMGVSSIDESAFVLIGRVMEAAERIGIEPQILAMWWSDADTHSYTDYNSSTFNTIQSVYDKIFRNKAVIEVPDFDDPTQFAANSIIYQGRTAYIASFARTSEVDVKEILDYLDVALFENVSHLILSRIYVIAELSRKFKVSVTEFLQLLYISNISTSLLANSSLPANASALTELESLVTLHRRISTSNFSLSELLLIAQNVGDVNKDKTSLNKKIQAFYEGMREALRKFALDNIDVDPIEYTDESRSRIKNIVIEHFAKQFDTPLQSAKVLISDLEVDVVSPASTIKVIDALIEPSFIFPNDNDDQTLDDDYSLSIENLTDLEASPSRPAQLPSFLTTDLYDVYYLIDRILLVSNKMGLTPEEFEYIYTNDNMELKLPLLPIGDNVASQTETIFNINSMLKLNSWIGFKNRIDLSDDAFISFMKDIASASIATLTEAFSIIDTTTEWGDEIDFLLGPANDILTIGAPHYNAGSGILKVVLEDFNISTIESAEMFHKVADILKVRERLNIEIDTIYNVLKSDLQLADAHKVMLAVKGLYNESAWFEIAKPLRDKLRMKQRDAMSDYILHQQEPYNTDKKVWRNQNELFSHFLIDTEMEPCMLTSRLKQAISSVQLFVNRISLGVEFYNYNPSNKLGLQPSALMQWERWRKWYRIWEANRKVFLYPENWIEPELRDSKSVFFEELETDLLKSELTNDLAEESYRSYLKKLAEVARLEPIATFKEYIHEEDELPPDGVYYVQSLSSGYDNRPYINHVMSRTYGAPHQYYYRKFDKGEWTPWERVDLNIKSDHVMLYMYNNRLYVYWLTFQKKMEKHPASTAPWGSNWFDNIKTHGSLNNGSIYSSYMNRDVIEINLNWAEYKDGIWQNEKYSTDSIRLKLKHGIDFPINDVIPGVHTSTYYGTGSGTGQKASKEKMYEKASKGGTLDNMDVIQTQLHIYGAIDKPTNRFALYVSAPIGSSWAASNMHALQCFVFEDNHSQPYVERTKHIGHSYNTPNGTSLLNNKYQKKSDADDWLQFVRNGIWGSTTIYSYNTNKQETSRIVWNGGNHKVLRGNKFGDYKLTTSSNFVNYDSVPPFFGYYPGNDFDLNNPLANDMIYEDDKHTFFGRNLWYNQANWNTWSVTRYPEVRFSIFYHPSAKYFLKRLNKGGLDSLLHLTTQNQYDVVNFEKNYGLQTPNTSFVTKPNNGEHEYPTGVVDFSYEGAYSIYNWELFFHTPMMIAQRLHDNQKFEEARKWYHYIFDPTSTTNLYNAITDSKQRFWRFLPFYKEAGSQVDTVADLINHINQKEAEALKQVEGWENDPFNPHRIARMRILAYMKNVVMKYVDNLIAWGDQLFRRDTIESINEATQLYIMADNILGKRPEEMPTRTATGTKTYDEIKGSLDALSNAKVAIEKYIDPHKYVKRIKVKHVTIKVKQPDGTVIEYPWYWYTYEMPKTMFYFCVPNNDKIMKYWDTVADRLFKVRNCMSIDGTKRQLALFQPPIDPALLVKAAAAGVDIGTVLNNISSGTPPYRFNYVVQKANEFCADVKSFGNLLLTALEKKDAEEIALLRATHQITMQEKMKLVKEIQVEEASASIEALKQSKETIKEKIDYYKSKEEDYTNAKEDEYMSLMRGSIELQERQAEKQSLASIMAIIPTFSLKLFAATGFSFGGGNLAGAAGALSAHAAANTAINNTKASMAQAEAGWVRRSDEWKFQLRVAQKEEAHIDKQIVSSEVRLAIVKKELENYTSEIENSKEVFEFLKNKYTNKQLYSWMVNQISSVYFQSYQLAYDMAKKAEKCFEYELPFAKIPASGFIKFGYWDSLKKGLLSGERLQHDIRKLEVAHIEQNERELELTKHVSLAMLDPRSLIDLIDTGECSFNIPEELYDLDYPGQYYRRIKSVSISIPCISGPYSTIACELSLTSHAIRKEQVTPIVDLISSSASGAIATSSAQNDNGMFEMNFNDSRYLPFEGKGAISGWTLKLSHEDDDRRQYRLFDFDSIRDVILHVKYTAQKNTMPLYKNAVIDRVNGFIEDYTSYAGNGPTDNSIVNNENIMSLPRYFSLKQEFASEWHKYANDNSFDITVDHNHFPQICEGKSIKVTRLLAYGVMKDGGDNSIYDFNESTNSIPYTDFNAIVPTSIASGFSVGNSTSFSFNFRKKSDASQVDIDTVFDDIIIVAYYDLTA